MVYVLSEEGKPLMPTKRFGKVRRMLRDGEAKVVKQKPFTIQLCRKSKTYTQSVTVGVDAGYETVGVSAVTKGKEVFGCEVELLKKMSERITEKAKSRRLRRMRKRHRKPRFDNRTRPEKWLAPSIRHKFDAHIKIVEKVASILPVDRVVVETANFDIQKIKNPDISGKEYQKGEQNGFWNLREYILHRDHHTCQYCKKKDRVLQVHHIVFWKEDRSDRPGNLITLCTKCHSPAKHKKGGILHGWEPKVRSFKPETFMSMVKWRVVNTLRDMGFEAAHTFGHITKSARISLGLDKSHVNDAFVIAGGNAQDRTPPFAYKEVRRNNRSLEKFYDAKYIDIRDGKKRSGQELFCGRRTRNKNLNTENLRKYRGEKTKKGRRNIRRDKYLLQPGDLVRIGKEVMQVAGMQSKGKYVRTKNPAKSVQVAKVSPYKFMRGMCVV